MNAFCWSNDFWTNIHDATDLWYSLSNYRQTVVQMRRICNDKGKSLDIFGGFVPKLM